MLMAGSIVFAGYGDRSSARIAREAGSLVLEAALKGWRRDRNPSVLMGT
jgi:hypothetical protein